MTWNHKPWTGVFAATLCPFREDQSLDELGLAEYISELASVEEIQGLVCNGHTGEVMSLQPEERAKVTAIVARAAAKSERSPKVASGIMAEGIFEATEHAIAAKEAGADAILLMPPHHWLRFGRTSATAITFCTEVADAAGIDIISASIPSLDEGLLLAE